MLKGSEQISLSVTILTWCYLLPPLQPKGNLIFLLGTHPHIIREFSCQLGGITQTQVPTGDIGRGRVGRGMDEWTIKTPNPICRLFFKIDLLTDFAALCFTDFIDWRYIHSWLVFSTQLVNCCPPWTKELYLCTVAPLSSLWPPPPLPKLNVLFIQTVSVWGGEGGGWIVLCRPFSAGILHSVSDQMQNLPNYFTTPNKMTTEDGGLVSLKFLRPGGGILYWTCGRFSMPCVDFYSPSTYRFTI